MARQEFDSFDTGIPPFYSTSPVQEAEPLSTPAPDHPRKLKARLLHRKNYGHATAMMGGKDKSNSARAGTAPNPVGWQGVAGHVGTQTQTKTRPFRVLILRGSDRFLFYLLSSFWLIGVVIFWEWWLQGEHVTSMPRMIINSVLVFWVIMMPGYFFFFVGRMSEPNPDIAPPKGRVAMIVTKAPSEPWSIIQRTLTAMLNQQYPYPFDVWLADEWPNEDVMDWCHANGIHLSTRHDFGVFTVQGFHNEEFPRRQKSKEGNLAYFYETYGYKNYDFVVQLDADHVPEPTYLAEMVRPFVDEHVGYVAAPSICNANTQYWSSRARLWGEAHFHGPVQAGYNIDGFSPTAIGSHYAVRVVALRSLIHPKPKYLRKKAHFDSNGNKNSNYGHSHPSDAYIMGGLGPELAEDFSTSFAMNANGFRGIFAFKAIASGDGAETFTDLMTQEMQWSRSLMTILLAWASGYFRLGKDTMPTTLKAQFAFVQMWYPLFTFTMFIAHLFPLYALIFKAPWVRVSYVSFMAHMMPPMITALLIIQLLKSKGHLRPADAKLFSWELMVFQFARWPWAFLGVIQAIVGVLLLKRELTFKVTPKASLTARPMPSKILYPYLAIVLASSLTAILVSNPGLAVGYYYFALLNAFVYTLVSVIVTFMHYKESRGKIEGSTLNFMKGPASIAGMMVICTLAALIVRLSTTIEVVFFYGR